MLELPNRAEAGERLPAARRLPRLLYLGNALPPGVSKLFPECQPAGHLVETSLVGSIESWFEVKSVGCSSLDLRLLPENAEGSCGLANELNLTDRAPEVFYRRRSLWQLRRQYRRWATAGWEPDLILVCNLSPIYDAFIRWLSRQPSRPKLVLYLADSNTLGVKVAWSKRVRYRFKPLVYAEEEMIRYFDACVAVSPTTESTFKELGVPWLWLPNGCEAARARWSKAGDRAPGPLRFGYVGALGSHAGFPDLLRVFMAKERDSVLHVCGFGKARLEVAAKCRNHPRLRFHTSRTPDECLDLSHGWDVLINPRPLAPANRNNFPSKVFEYALSGRAILTSRVSGADVVLGPDAYYFDEHQFDASLGEKLDELSHTPRTELDRRGAAIQQRLITRFTWKQQGERLNEFLSRLLAKRAG